MNRMLKMWFQTPDFDYTWYIAFVIVLLVVPLCLVRDISKFSFAHMVGDLAVLSTVVLLAYQTINIMVTDPNYNMDHVLIYNIGWAKLLGMAVTSQEGVGVILPIKVSESYKNM
jgi:proton-coupled amino acid transporter